MFVSLPLFLLNNLSDRYISNVTETLTPYLWRDMRFFSILMCAMETIY